ncbi:NADH-quinone oxidoreductase subunit C [Candidatus Fermentibacteria bacterium]|nr:NADH-quinone oxidoreductase subunit C [Candidatus Fermentibacteria bacterium]
MDRALIDSLSSTFDALRVEVPREDRLTVQAPRDAVMSVLSFLKGRGYDHLHMVSCVDWMEEGQFELVYVLSAYGTGQDSASNPGEEIILKTRIPRELPTVVSSISLFKNAEPYEREIHELFGVRFEGHPRLTPLFLERDYEIPPFRKDFDTRQYVEDFFGSIPPVGEEDQDV